MNAPTLSVCLIRLIIIVTVPMIACIGLYSVDYLCADSILTLPVILAYPVALIEYIGLTKA